jgi:hypothetical protein
MPLTFYHFKNAVSAFFEIPTERARELLPAPLQPLEVHHCSSILALTAFDFHDSMVGAYQEIVLAIVVPPLVKSGDPFPKSAMFPFLLGTSTAESRQHAIERWRLPHYMKNVSVKFEESNRHMHIRVMEGQAPVLDFEVTDYNWDPVDQLHQCFTHDEQKRFKVDIHMKGKFTEHEEERGTLELYDHPMCRNLVRDEIADRPFRELWMKDGTQTFEELQTL